MTLPAITYGNGFEEPCMDASRYQEVEDGCSATLSVIEGGIFDINVTEAGGNKIVYYHLANAISVSSSTYKKITFRFKMNNANIKAKIMLIFSSGAQTVLPETNTQVWYTYTIDITTAKTIVDIRLYATQSTGHVYYDFALIHKGTFTLPDFENFTFDNNKRKAILGPPTRGGDIQQDLGLLSSDLVIDGVMKAGETWGGSTYKYGEYLLEAWRNDTFCWFTSDPVNALVMVDRVRIGQEKESAHQRTFSVEMSYFSKSDMRATLWDGLAWLGKG